MIKGFILGLAVSFLVYLALGMPVNIDISWDTPFYDEIITTADFTTEDWYLPVKQDITIKYLNDPGLVVKWTDGVLITGNNTSQAEWIQRFEPWLNERTEITYNVTWEK